MILIQSRNNTICCGFVTRIRNVDAEAAGILFGHFTTTPRTLSGKCRSSSMNTVEPLQQSFHHKVVFRQNLQPGGRGAAYGGSPDVFYPWTIQYAVLRSSDGRKPMAWPCAFLSRCFAVETPAFTREQRLPSRRSHWLVHRRATVKGALFPRLPVGPFGILCDGSGPSPCSPEQRSLP
jgi:hypothetical protein